MFWPARTRAVPGSDCLFIWTWLVCVGAFVSAHRRFEAHAAVKIIEVAADPGHGPTIAGVAEKEGVVDFWSVTAPAGDGERQLWHLLVKPEACQAVLDALQSILADSKGARIVMLPVEATLPRVEEKTPIDEGEGGKAEITREALYESVAKGARLDANYLLMVALSTVVAAIGLNEDSVAIVIGAMVIAPLLGPNLALALATAMGDAALMYRAATAGILGLLLALGLSFLIGLGWAPDLASQELVARTRVGMDSIALALASGAAATLSLTAAVPTALVGVMVAVALLPPTATIGIMLGGAHFPEVFGATLLLAVNIVCVNLAAKLVFLLKGVRPRTWLEKRKASQSMKLYIGFWAVSLIVLIAAMLLWQRGVG